MEQMNCHRGQQQSMMYQDLPMSFLPDFRKMRLELGHWSYLLDLQLRRMEWRSLKSYLLVHSRWKMGCLDLRSCSQDLRS